LLRAVHFQRKPRPLGNFSVENYFKAIRDLAPDDLNLTCKICKFESNGLFKRLFNIAQAWLRQEEVNHITGDVHFLNLLFHRRKSILTVLDCGMLKGVGGLKYQLFKYFWFTLPAKKANYITVISEATKKDLLKYIHYDPAKIKVIHVSISDLYRPFKKHFNADKPIILQIGTAPNKNLERIIPALSGISCTYTILGRLSENQRNLLMQNQVEFENIDKAISDQEVLSLYQSCDLVSFVSTLEGFGMPIVEANATGRAVITGNTTSMPEIAGDAAHLVDPFDIEAIREGFIKVISDEEYRNQLISNGYRNVQRFDKSRIAEQYFSLYRMIGGG